MKKKYLFSNSTKMSAFRVGHLLVSDLSGQNDQYVIEHTTDGLSINNRGGTDTKLVLRSAADSTQMMTLTHDRISASSLTIDADFKLNNGAISGSNEITFNTPDLAAVLRGDGQLTLVPNGAYSYTPLSSPGGLVLDLPDTTFTDTTTVTNPANFAASRLGVPTLDSTNALVTDIASTLEIAGSPIGANTSINHAYALLVSSGLVKIADDLSVRDVFARAIDSSTSLTATQATLGRNSMSVGSWQRGFIATVAGAQFTDTATSDGSTLNDMNAVFIGRSTLNAANNGVTATTASTLTIEGPPATGTNYTIGTSYALRVVDGLTSLQELEANGALTVAGNAAFGGSISSGVISIAAPGDQGSCLKMRPHSDGSESSIGWFGTATGSDSPWKLGVQSGNLVVWNGTLSPVFTWTTTGISSNNLSLSGNLSVAGTAGLATVKTSSIVKGDGSTRLSITSQMYLDDTDGVVMDSHLTANNGISANSKRITAVGEPQAATDAATMAYVNSKIQGLSVKSSVDTTTTANVDLANDLAVGATVSGVTLAAGDRILVMGQTDATQNGIYVAGSPATRSADFGTGAATGGAFVFSEDTGAGFLSASDGVVGTDAITFSQFNGAASFITGDALQRNGNTLSVRYDGTSIDLANNQLRLAAGVAGTGLSGGAGTPLSVNASQTQITAIGTLTSGTWNADVIALPYGGTGLNSIPAGQIMVGAGTSPVQTSGDLTFDIGAKLLTVANASAGALAVTSTSQLGLSSNTLNANSTSALSVSGDIQLTNATRQSIIFRDAGYAAPTMSSRSIGSKLILLPSVSASAVDFGIGVGTSPAYLNTPSSQWYSTSSAGYEHQFYNGTTKSVSISAAGTIISSGTLAVGAITPDGTIPLEVQAGVASGKDMVRIRNTTADGSSSIVMQDSTNTGRLRVGVEGGVSFAQSVNTSLSLDSANVLINTRTPSQYALDVAGSVRVAGPLRVTGQYIGLPSMAASAKQALTAQQGSMVFESDSSTVQVYDGSAWKGVGENSLAITGLAVATAGQVNVASVALASGKIIRSSVRTSVYATVTITPTAGQAVTELHINVPNLPSNAYDAFVQSSAYIESSFEKVENLVVATSSADGNLRCRFTSGTTGVHVLQVSVVF